VKKTPARRRPVAVSIGLAFVLIALPLALYVWGSHSSTFAIRAIVLEGADRVAVKRAAHLLEKTYLGRNLFTVRSSQIQKTLAPLLFMKSAGIDRDFPSTLRVRLTEHSPGVYALAGDRWYLVSSDGVVLGAVTRETRKPTTALKAGPEDMSLNLPAVVADGELEKDQATGDAEVLTALRVLGALPRKVVKQVSWVRTSGSGVRLRLADGPVVDLGPADRLSAKAYSLGAVLHWYASRHAGADYVDVSVPDRPIARPVL
jgi:cell division septal protein FtsQ